MDTHKKSTRDKKMITNSLEDCKMCFHARSNVERVRDCITLNMADLGAMNH